MAGIGLYTTRRFFFPDGGPQIEGMTVADITRPNVGGVAFKETGVRGMPFRAISESDYSDAATLALAIIAFFGFKGTVVSFTSELGTVWGSYMAVDVRVVSARGYGCGVGMQTTDGTGGYTLTLEWVLQYTGY